MTISLVFNDHILFLGKLCDNIISLNIHFLLSCTSLMNCILLISTNSSTWCYTRNIPGSSLEPLLFHFSPTIEKIVDGDVSHVYIFCRMDFTTK